MLSQLDSLEELSLDGEFRGDTVESLLRLKRLKSLYLASPNISRAALKHLEKFDSLTELDVVSAGISVGDIAKLQAAIPKCSVNNAGF